VCRRAGAVVGLVLAPSDVCVGSPALRLGRLVASSLRDASTSLPLLSVLSSLGRKQRWWRCCSQGLRGRFGRSETTGVYVARLWGRGHTFPHFTRRPTHSYRPHRCRPLRAMNTDFPGPGFTTPYPLARPYIGNTYFVYSISCPDSVYFGEIHKEVRIGRAQEVVHSVNFRRIRGHSPCFEF
jgi:hypothetical protein